jgi:hypothetical protein
MKKYRLFYMIDEGGNVLEASSSPSHWGEKYSISGIDVLKSCVGCGSEHQVGFSKVKFKMVDYGVE